ncbi:carbohydrate kinase, partial [Rhizobium ruizarguesonis]
ATRSVALRRSLSAAVNAPIRQSRREETGAAGVAMMAAVAVGVYSSMDDCIADWVTPLLGDPETPDASEAHRFDRLFSAYTDVRQAMAPAWDKLAEAATTSPVGE